MAIKIKKKLKTAIVNKIKAIKNKITTSNRNAFEYKYFFIMIFLVFLMPYQ